MPRPVFISYSRTASTPQAQSLAARLADLAFLDTTAIDDGAPFPPHILDAILDASIVVIFATTPYSQSRFCRLEMRLALAGGDATASHLILALGEGHNAVLDTIPTAAASRNWPTAAATDRLESLTRERLTHHPPAIRDRLSHGEARKLSTAFLEESKLPQPHSLHGILCSFPPGMDLQSIGARFVGRADLLHTIHQKLSERATGAAQLTGRIASGGGFGKTRAAIEYLHRYAPYYPGGIFWLNAESSDIEGEFWRVLKALNPAVPQLEVMRTQSRDVRGELEQALRKIGKPALYVIDNIPEADPGTAPPPMSRFCPAQGAVTILATSRQDTVEKSVKSIAVDTLERDSAILLLTDNVLGSAALSWTDWGRIAEWVGDLPFALDLLNPCLALGAVSPRALLDRVNPSDQPPSATGELDRLSDALRGQVPANAVRGVTEAFSISFAKLDGATQQVAQLLAQLAPAPIPEAFIEALPDEWKSPGIRAALRSRHFVTSTGDLSFGVMHRLMADFLRTLAGEKAPELLNGACSVLRRVMTQDRCADPRHWPVMRLCRPHAEALFARGSATDVTALASSAIGSAVAFLVSEQGDHAGARRLQERVLEVRTRVLGPEHLDTLMSMNNLAETLRSQGDHAGARRFQERVLEVSTRMLGDEHPVTLASMNNLAGTLTEQGDRAGARRLLERVLEVRKRVLGEEHPDTLTSTNNLAGTLTVQGDHAGARRLQERVLELRLRVLGEAHPHTLTLMDNLAGTLLDQGDYAGARRFQERVLEVSTCMLGEEHPATLTSMNNLASTLVVQGDHAGARRLWERVLEVRMRVLGEEHPNTLTSMSNLAEVLRAQGDQAGARQLGERALEVITRVLGEEHPATLTLMNNLALTLAAEGDHAGARRLGERVLEVRTRVLGEEHPDTLGSMNNLAGTLREQGDHAGARRLQGQTLEVMTRVLGEEHPATLTSMNNLAFLLFQAGDLKGAIRLLRKCLSGQRRVLGEEHPDTAAIADALRRLEAQPQAEPPAEQSGS